jgi:uncharacterized membrane protein
LGGFFIAVAVFMIGHIVPGLLRKSIIGRIGFRGYILIFSILSIVLFGWVIQEVLTAESPHLWDYQIWQGKLLIIVMLPTSILWVSAIRQPCPLSIGRRRGFDPTHPGINAFCRHPLLLGMLIWGIGHLMANGDLVKVLFFGGSAAFAVIGFWRMEKIRLRDIPEMDRGAVLSSTRRFAPTGLLRGAIGLWDFVGGVILYVLMLIGHGHVIGVYPLEMVGW